MLHEIQNQKEATVACSYTAELIRKVRYFHTKESYSVMQRDNLIVLVDK